MSLRVAALLLLTSVLWSHAAVTTIITSWLHDAVP
ncbi:unnamed protein product [Coregonus sp. 'balchen']|nr:unnamed protein product [Coregonus sp. 'balchen']